MCIICFIKWFQKSERSSLVKTNARSRHSSITHRIYMTIFSVGGLETGLGLETSLLGLGLGLEPSGLGLDLGLEPSDLGFFWRPRPATKITILYIKS